MNVRHQRQHPSLDIAFLSQTFHFYAEFMHGIMSIYVSGVVLACGYFTISLVGALKCLVIFDGRFSGCRERNRLIDIPENSKVYRC